MADDIVAELRAHRDIDTNQCCECDHWTDHDHDCMVGRAADEIERLRQELRTTNGMLEAANYEVARLAIDLRDCRRGAARG